MHLSVLVEKGIFLVSEICNVSYFWKASLLSLDLKNGDTDFLSSLNGEILYPLEFGILVDYELVLIW